MRLGEVDWNNKDSVIAYCKQLGGDSVVIKHADRQNYNITGFSNLQKYFGQPIKVIHMNSDPNFGKITFIDE